MTTQPIAEDYTTLFQQNVIRSVQAVLTRARRDGSYLPDVTARERIMTVLEHAFRPPETWLPLKELLLLLAPKVDQAGLRAQWLPHLERGLATSITNGDRAAAAALHCDIGLMHQRLDKLTTAQEHLQRACILAREEKNPLLLGLALQRLAEIARLQRHYQECNAFLREAETLVTADPAAQAYGLFIAGKAAFDQHDLTAAAAAFTQAMAFWHRSDNPGRAALCLQNLARIAAARGEPLTAIPLYEQAIALLTASGDLSNLAVVQMNLGVAYYECRQYAEALALYTAAEASFHAMSDDRYLAMVYNNLGLGYAALGEWQKAEASLQRSIELYQQVDDSKAWISAKGNLGITYLDQAHYAPAIQILQEALAELQTTEHDPEYERLHQALSKYLGLAQQGSAEAPPPSQAETTNVR